MKYRFLFPLALLFVGILSYAPPSRADAPPCAPVDCVQITIETSPGSLVNSYYLDGTMYSGTHTFTIFGDFHTLQAVTPAYTQSFDKGYSFVKWEDNGSLLSTNPRVTHYISTNDTFLAVYTQVGGCGSQNPFQELLSGCYIPGAVDALAGGLGRAPWLSFVLLGINVAIYNKTQSVWITLMILWVTGAVFVFAFPAYVGQIAEIFLALGTAGIAVKLLLRPS